MKKLRNLEGYLKSGSIFSEIVYKSSKYSCDHGRKFLCKYCGESCGQARCPEVRSHRTRFFETFFFKDPKPEEYQFPDQFPDCNWGCYCPDDKIWSPMHNDCLDGDYDTICNGPVSLELNSKAKNLRATTHIK